MRTQTADIKRRKKDGGYVLMVTLALASAGAVVLAVALNWSSHNAVLTSRNNEYFATSYAAEAATEKVFAQMSRDYQNYGEGIVYSRKNNYITGIPSASDDPYWSSYGFNDAQGGSNRVFLERINPTNYIVLGPPYGGLHALASTYQIIANAKNKNSEYQITGAVGQEINLGTIPIFQFAIFYEPDLEIHPGAPMNIRGLVHGNNNIYAHPGSALTFFDDVSASGSIKNENKEGDTTIRSGSVTFNDYHLDGTTPLNLPIGTNTTGMATDKDDNVYAILEIPPSGESPTSDAGTNRLYNKADIILLVSNNVVIATTGQRVDGATTIIPSNQWSWFLKTNSTFLNKRENFNVQPVVLDVNQLRKWSTTNTALFGGRDVQSVYIADLRPTSNAVPVTNYTYATNFTFITNQTTATSLVYPDTNTVIGAVNNSSILTNSPPPTLPAGAFNITTNTTTVTTTGLPAAGYYSGSIATNTTSKSSTTYPSAGTFVPPVTSQKKNGVTTYTYNKINDYTYKKINSFSYSLPAFVYLRITGITTNAQVTTNIYYSTNYIVFAQSGIVLTNGSRLPSSGLTVATPDPLYIIGDYNVTTNGTAFSRGIAGDTTNTAPAAIMADAVTILSGAWNPTNSTKSLSSRVANNTTVNAAFLAGIVPTGGGHYSGGVENFPRFLEDWSGGKIFTYNGSMTVLFNSRAANAPWGGSDVYNPPNRNWTFDNNFYDPRKLPPLTPQVLSVTKGKWALISPNTTGF